MKEIVVIWEVVHSNETERTTCNDTSGAVSVAGYSVAEVDQAGAGYCFGGAFVASRLRELAARLRARDQRLVERVFVPGRARPHL